MAYKYTYDLEEVTYTPQKLQTNRNPIKYFILGILTLGIYNIIFFIPFSYDLDKIAPKPDRSKTFNFFFAYILASCTLTIVLQLWHYQIAQRIEEALDKRKILYDFGTDDYWTWWFWGSLYLVGPCVYIYKLCKAMNLLCQDYNERPIIE